ncbi:lipid II flippase MurJ [Agromyces rhizosphaerae]|uniref:Lipid II flippase MurJ n=1 Tax=Agromyces rhizosphaerae TaxID=88374 RepID=A0A9W6FPA2_9MICO|nr:murein biosynthesis integral membrane protein MurJ [Agromyces rhizosphaerae]GLI27255.1 lipid II flippase MurJ [Agromyces rhizosphaerae]
MAGGDIGRASMFLASGTVVSRLLGFVRSIVLAAAIGLVGSASADAFAVANQLPNTVYTIVAGGVLTAVLVPQIVRAGLQADGGAAYINKLLTIALVILAAATLVATLAAPLLTLLYGTQLDPDTLALATAFAWWCLPQIFFYGLYTLLGEVLNARKSFGPYTWSPVLNNVVALAGLAAVMIVYGADPDGTRDPGSWTPDMIALLGGTATLGVAAQALVLFWFWRRVGLRYRPDFRWRGVGLGDAGRMASWTFGMLLLTTFAGIVQTNVAGIASDSAASVATLAPAWLIFMLPHSVIAVSIGTAYFTRMSEHAAAGDTVRLRDDIGSAIRGVGLLMVVSAGIMIVCAYPMAAVFAPGNFASVSAFGNVIIGYLIGLVPFSTLFLVQRSFYALGDTRTPFFFTLFQVVLFVGLAISCAALPVDLIAVGIAVSTSIAGTAQLVLALVLLRRRLGQLGFRAVVVSFIRDSVAIVPAVLLGVVLLIWLGGTTDGGFAVDSRLGAIVSMVAIGLAMGLLYLAGLWVLRSPELRTFAAPVISRLRRR